MLIDSCLRKEIVKMQATLPEAQEGTTYLWFHLFLVIASVINSCCDQQLVPVKSAVSILTDLFKQSLNPELWDVPSWMPALTTSSGVSSAPEGISHSTSCILASCQTPQTYSSESA